MKKEASKKSKLWIWLLVGIVALLAVAGVVLAIVLGGSGDPGAEGPKGGRADLYWNIDRVTYTENSESGLSTREPGEDGVYRVRYAYNGSLVELEIADKQLVNYIDTMDCMGIVQDANGVVIDVIDPKTIATETARMFYVRAAEAGKITLNSSMAMNGMNMDIEIKEVTEIYDVSAKAETPGMKVEATTLQSMDSVTVYSNDLGEATHVYVISHPVESPVYWRADKGTYSSTEKKTTRVPDAEGYYTVPFFVNGERVELKCNIEGIVSTIDAKNRFKAHTGLVLDENGYIVDNMLAATGIRGLLGCEMFDVTAVNGTSFTAEGLLAGKGEIYEGTLAADAVIYDVSEQAKPDVRGKAVDSLKVGDRIVAFENADGQVIQVYVAQRMLDMPMFFNVTKKYSSANKCTTRTPDSNGWYYIDLMSEGVVKTYKTKDIELINAIDSKNHRSVAVELDGDIITYVYDGEAVAGYGAHVGYTVVSSTGSIISISAPNNPDNIVNRILNPECKIYNMSGVGQKKGEITTLQEGDYCIMWRNARSEIVYIYVIRRMVDAPIYFSLSRKWDGTRESTTRVPDENGWYIYECICEAKKVTVKTKSKTVADFLDSQGPQTFALKVDKNGVIYEYYETAAVTGGNKAYLNTIVKRLDTLVLWNPTTNKTYTPKLAEGCRIYNYSNVYEKARGERTTLQLNDNIQCYTNTRGEIAVVLVRQRKITADVYFSKNRVKTVDEKGYTTRQPDADGWYVFECALNGKEVTVKTKDIEVATMMDAQSPQAFALKVDKNGVIQKAYPAAAATGGSTRALNAVVKSVDNGKIVVRLTNGEDFEMPMASKYKAYNVSDNYDDHWGEATKIKVGDTLQSYTDSSNKVVLVYVRSRPGDLRMAWVIDQQYDKENKVSLRKPDANGQFTVKLAIDGAIKEYKVEGQKVINYIDSANGAVAVSLKSGVITNAQSAIYGPGIWTSTKAAVIATVQSINGNTFTVKKSDGTTVDIPKADAFVCYDVSGKAEFMGKAATPAVGDYGRMYLNMDEQVMFFYILRHGDATAEPGKPTVKEYNNANLAFQAGTNKAECTYCGKVVEWTALEQISAASSLAPGGHYYLAEDQLNNTSYYNAVGGSKEAPAVVCVHLNGHNITSTARAFAAQRYNTLNIMGNGTVTGGNANNPVINSSSTVNVIGGTYVANAGAKSVIIQQRATEAVSVYKDVVITSAENTDGGAIYVTFGNLNLYGATVNGNIYAFGYTGTTRVATKLVLMDATVDGAVKLNDNEIATCELLGDTVITAKNGGLTLEDKDSLVKVTIGELGANAKIHMTGNGVLTNKFDNASAYLGTKILAAYDTITLKVEDKAIVASGEIPTEPEPPAPPVEEDEPTWVLAWVVDPAFDGSNTTRTPDANGYYFVKLSVDGVTKTYKTKTTGLTSSPLGIDYVDQSGSKNRAVAICLTDKDSLEFTEALGATNNTGAKSAVVTTITDITDGVITGVDKAYTGKVAANGKIFDVSDKAVVEGELTTLAVGDNVRFYNDADGNVLYAYIYTRTIEPEHEPVPTWKMAIAQDSQYDSTNAVTTRTPDADGYYYIDLAIDGVVKTYKTKTRGTDGNGNGIDYADNVASKNRPFAVYLTDVNSDEFTLARSALYAPDVEKAGNSGVVITAINGNVISGNKDTTAVEDTLADNVEIYDISATAAFKGVPATLAVGDTYRNYLNAEGKVVFAYITVKANVTPEPEPVDMNTVSQKADAMASVFATDTGAGVEAECPVCQKVVTWTALPDVTAKTVMASGHYYAKDQTITAGYLDVENGVEVCVHLNGATIENTVERVFYVDKAAKLNVMGSGTVIGGRSASTSATVFRCGNALEVVGEDTVVNLCGGTWSKSKDDLDVLGCRARGNGGLNIYDGTTVNIGTVAGNALWVAGNTVTLAGGEINGNIFTKLYAKASATVTYAPELIIDGATVNGQVTFDTSIAGDISFTVMGDSVIADLVADPAIPVQVGRLTDGADIKVTATGAFTAKNENLQSYVDAGYITAKEEGMEVTVTDGIASITAELPPVSFTDNLVFAEGTTNAVCPVCEAVVEWSALPKVEATRFALEDGKHYYLDADQLENVGFYNLASGKACVHLNGHSVTSTSRAFSNQGNTTLNIMGNGTVTGSATNTTCATIYSAGWLNLYAGTYTSVNSSSAVLSQQKANKGITVYKDASVVASADVEGSAVNVVFGTLDLIDTTVTGNIYVKALSGTTPVTSPVTVNNSTVTGEILVANYAANTGVTVSGAAVCDVNLVAETLLTVNELTLGADIKVTADGVFTAANDLVQKYVDDGFITAKEDGKTISVTDGIASITAELPPVSFTDNLVFAEGTTEAMCPVCEAVVEWNALPKADAKIALEDGKHYYLDADQLENVNFYNLASGTACVHLNGHSVTSTSRAFSNQGNTTLNIMGNGTVTGSATNTTCATIYSAGWLNLYAGTYTSENSSSAVLSQQKASKGITVYKDASVVASADVEGSAINVVFGTLDLIDTTVTGNIYVKSLSNTTPVTSRVTVNNSTVTGEILVANYAASTGVTVSGAAVCDVNLVAGTMLTLDRLSVGAEINVTAADGAFTNANDRAADYLAYGWIKAADAAKTITEQDGVLFIG